LIGPEMLLRKIKKMTINIPAMCDGNKRSSGNAGYMSDIYTEADLMQRGFKPCITRNGASLFFRILLHTELHLFSS